MDDLESVVEFAHSLTKGDNPNMSRLLGVRGKNHCSNVSSKFTITSNFVSLECNILTLTLFFSILDLSPAASLSGTMEEKNSKSKL